MNNNLSAYIAELRRRGVSEEDIRSQLLNSGWSAEEINESFTAPEKVDVAGPGSPDSITDEGILTQRPLSRRYLGVAIGFCIVLAAGAVVFERYWKHGPAQQTTLATASPSTVALSTPTPTPPAGLKAPYAYNDTLEMVTGWVPSGVSSCILTDLSVIVSPVQTAALEEQKALLGGKALFPKVQSDGTFSVLVAKGQNVSFDLDELPLPGEAGSQQVCLGGYYLATSKEPVRVDARSTTLNLMLFGSPSLPSVTSATIDKISSLSSFQSLANYLTTNLRKAPLSTITDESVPEFSAFSELEHTYIKDVQDNIRRP